LKWFKHDSDANMDAKLKRLRIKYGMAGYGLYWYCLELIAQGIDQKKITFELEHDSEILAHDTGINYQLVSEMMIFMVDLGLFENVNGVITCFKMAMRLDDHTARNPQIKDIQAKLFKHTTDKLRSDNEVTTDTLSSRVEESRVEENTIDNKLTTTVKPQYEQEDLNFANKMFQSIVNQNEGFKKPNLEGWAKTVRLMRESDHRDYQTMASVWTWARNDSFWQSNILSANKFRQQFDQLSVKMRGESNVQTNKYQPVDNSAPAQVRRAREERDAKRNAASERAIN
tara:strand:+ start:615 stop:1469 length:855 start_codon:yes stop_codon:yes gene_type:complete